MFNDARGEAATLQQKPPFKFRDVTMALFPVPASLERLQSFCDAQLNVAPDLVQFQPAMPYVLLMVLDYGKMSAKAANMGWISQYEVAFAIPMRWSFMQDGKLRFFDWATVCPFIFVDNELSMSTGRQVYGWPKLLVDLDPAIGEWVNDPHGVREMLCVSSRVIGKAYSGERATGKPLLSVHHEGPPRLADFPTNLTNLFDPIRSAPETLGGLMSGALDFTRALGAIGLGGMSGTAKFPDLTDPNTLRKLMKRQTWDLARDRAAWAPGLRDLAWSMLPRMGGNTINLKQFRDSASPSEACYQAITNSAMKAQTVYRGGLLGQQNVLLGQIDGGYRIDIHGHGSQPIVESLGLKGTSMRLEEGVPVISLKPQFPLWFRMDMDYGKGEVVAWRARTTAWRLGSEMRERLQAENKTAPVSTDAEPLPAPAYVTARGPALQAVPGPFSIPNATVRVMPLLAKPESLATFVSEYLDVDQELRFRPWGQHVYAVAYNYTDKLSKVNDVGLLSSREVTFLVPTRCYDWYDDSDYDLATGEGREQRDREKLRCAGVVRAFSYVDDTTVAITGNEVAGVPTLRANIDSPPQTWMENSGPEDTGKDGLLRVSALVLPALNVGAETLDRSLLTVHRKPPCAADDTNGWRHIAGQWAPSLIDDLDAKYDQRGFRDEQFSESDSFRRVRSLALELMAGKLPLNTFSLKQFRDSWNTDRACYQGIVRGSTRIDRLYELHEIEKPLHLSIAQFPTQPIAKTLGLIPKYEEVTAAGLVQTFEAVRPFWFRADLTEDVGQTLYERAGQTGWTKVEDPDGPAAPDENGRIMPRKLMSSYSSLNHLDRIHVAELSTWLEAKMHEAEITTHAELAADLGYVWPATIMDSVLSRQWARPMDHRQEHHKADFCVPRSTFGPAIGRVVFPKVLCQREFWPVSEDFAKILDDDRIGRAWRLWSELKTRVSSVEPAIKRLQNDAQLAALQGLAPFVLQSRDDEGPDQWSAQDWTLIAGALDDIIANGHYQAGFDWRTVLRPLDHCARDARSMSAVQDTLKDGRINPDAKPGEVGPTLRQKLARVADLKEL